MGWFSKEEKKELLESVDTEDEWYGTMGIQEEALKPSEQDKKIRNNLYNLKEEGDNSKETVKEYKDKLNFVHNILKGRLLNKIIHFFMAKHRDKLVKTLPDKYQFEKLNAFNRAFEGALNDWGDYYRRYHNGKVQPAPSNHDSAADKLRFVKEVYLTVCSQDSAYMEFHNMLMYHMVKEMKGIPGEHLMYIDSGVSDVKYFLPVANWHTEEDKQLATMLIDGNIRCQEVVKNVDGTLDFKLYMNKQPKFVKNTNLT